MTDEDGRVRYEQSVDSAVVRLVSLFTYWAIVAVVALGGLIEPDMMIALALAPLAFLGIEAVARRVGVRIVR